MIEKAMAEAGFSVKQGKTAKSQVGNQLGVRWDHSSPDSTKVSECIKQLQTDSSLPIQRARMRIKVSMPTEDGERLREQVTACAEKVEIDNITQADWEVVCHFQCFQ